MIKRIWTWWRIISVIILSMVILLFAGGLFRSFSSGDLVIVLFFVVTLMFLIYLFIECAFPKRFDCMKIVRKYLSFKELKSCIKKSNLTNLNLMINQIHLAFTILKIGFLFVMYIFLGK